MRYAMPGSRAGASYSASIFFHTLLARTVASTPQGATVEWRARVVDANAPWFAVVVPDGDVSRRAEVVVR